MFKCGACGHTAELPPSALLQGLGLQPTEVCRTYRIQVCSAVRVHHGELPSDREMTLDRTNPIQGACPGEGRGQPIYLTGIRQALQGSRRAPLNGLGRGCIRQRPMRELFLPPSNANYWSGAALPLSSRHAWPASASSKASTIPPGGTPPWGIARPFATNRRCKQTDSPPPSNRPPNRGNLSQGAGVCWWTAQGLKLCGAGECWRRSMASSGAGSESAASRDGRRYRPDRRLGADRQGCRQRLLGRSPARPSGWVGGVSYRRRCLRPQRRLRRGCGPPSRCGCDRAAASSRGLPARKMLRTRATGPYSRGDRRPARLK